MQTGDLKYLLAYAGPLLVFNGLYQGGLWSFGAFLFAFLFVPLIELLLPEGLAPNPSQRQARQIHPFFDFLLYLNLPLVYGMIIYYARMLATSDMSLPEMVGNTLGVGIFLGASGINVAHELGHRSHRVETWMSLLLLLPALYQHFYVEHNRGHHRNVATPRDPATARYGENLYHFWFRSIIDGIKSAIRLEKKRLEKKGKKLISISNLMVQFAIMQLLYLLLIYLFFGAFALLMIVVVALIAVLMLESINYIEHYGLLRKEISKGRFERVTFNHSWNSNHSMGRILLYELTLHADHHHKASKKYQMLQGREESPHLPTGYPGSILLAMVPPLWFNVMNHRVPQSMI